MLTRRKLAVLLFVLALASAILTASPNNYTVVGASLALYAVVLLTLLSHCEKSASIRELRSILLLIAFSTSIGVLLGVLVSQTLLSMVTASSISVLLLLYTLFSTRWYR